jgi:hypothetical protein
MKRAMLLLLRWVAIGVVIASCGDDDSSAPGASVRTDASPVDSAIGSSVHSAAVSLTLSAMSTEPPESHSSEYPDTTLDPAYVDVDVGPGLGTDGFVGARDDVQLERCELDGDHWVAGGTVTNTSGAGAGYRIYVAFNPPDSAEARGLVQVDFLIPEGETKVWEAVAWIADPDLECLLRVERVSG